MCKYIVVTGGVISGIGKGISAASIGMLLKHRGFNVSAIKLDGYLNINCGVIRPADHGEVYVCDDGSEVDLDLGSYERLIGINTSAKNICTSGTLYKELIDNQEMGKYLGQTLQILPHVSNLVLERLIDLGKDKDVVIVEIGGTIGDAESFAFFESIRQFKQKLKDDVVVCTVAPVLWMQTIKEFKTKPLQNSVKELQRLGLQPDILFCRSDRPIPEEILDKISMFTNVKREYTIEALDVASIYHVPIEFYERQVDDIFVDLLRLKRGSCRIRKYRELVEKTPNSTIKVGVFGKYDNCDEAYLSIREALKHAALANDVNVEITWFNTELLESKQIKELDIHAAIVPGGFDKRGIEGKIAAIKYIRENRIPFLGICLGLQCAVIEFARNVLGLKDANSLEFDNSTNNPVIHYVKGQENLTKKLGTMRLGAYDCELTKNSLAYSVYDKKLISERHRHRYEVNSQYEEELTAKGFHVSGKNPESNLIEIMELDTKLHPYFVGTQAHPEFRSKLLDPAPLFMGLIQAAKVRNGKLLDNAK